MVTATDVEGADGQWLRNLKGSGQHPPSSYPPLVAQARKVLGPGALEWAVDLGYEMASTVIAKIAEFGDDEESFQTLRMGTESGTLRAMLLLVGEDPGTSSAGEEALEGDRDFVRRRIPLELVLRGIRVGHSVLDKALMDAAATVVEEPLKTREMKRTSAILFDFIDQFASSMAAEYLIEHERWVTTAASERTELVRSILDGQPVSVAEASATLGYPLDRHHLAAVLWRDAGAPSTPADLQRIASGLLTGGECGETLLIPFGASSVWVWASRNSPDVSMPELVVPPESGVRVSVGTFAPGLAGFRQSHREALQAADLLRTSTTASLSPVTWYADVDLTVLLSRDVDLARAFVQRELGPLAADTVVAAELRETLAVYLASGRSLAAAAEILHVARNTVSYRVNKVENETGRDLRHRRLELECALRLAQRMGAQVLRV